jgi:hypothetical protein
MRIWYWNICLDSKTPFEDSSDESEGDSVLQQQQENDTACRPIMIRNPEKETV